MHFVKTEELKTGMRLARPIYNKKSILLFDRNSLLSVQAIESIRNFGLIGVYVLEPAEPLPPMTQEDLEFERFQIKAVSAIEEELDRILKTRKQSRIQTIADMVIRNYGHLDEKINFYQNLRSLEDYVSRHSLNVAILCAMITHVMNIRREEQYHTVCAIRRICQQAAGKQLDLFPEEGKGSRYKMLEGSNVLLVANRYDEITAMTLQGTAQSEVKAAQELLEHPEVYDPETVQALLRSINILPPGASVELSTGEKALVLSENEENVLCPTVVSFRDNSILNLALPQNEDIQIVDVMKTMDNRYILKK